ncbi:MAG: DNA polymerase I [Candidatus Omnitrophota bacterium]
MPKKNLFLIDGNSFCYRAFYAVRSLSNSKGQPTNAVFGFVSMLNKIIKEYSPDMLAVAFDLKGPTFRHEKFEEYKIHRKPMPDDLVSQMPIIKKLVAAYNIPIYELQGYEADDVLATLAVCAKKKDINTYIVTGDKDALQLVSDEIKVISPHKDNFVYDRDKVKERFHVWPERVPDVMGLMGDASDNIPGVPGVGEKTAIDLIAEFGCIDNLYDHIDEVKGESKKKILKEHEPLARLSKELAQLDTEVPLKIDFGKLALKEPNTEALVALYKELEFKNLLKEASPATRLSSKYECITDMEKFRSLVKELRRSKDFAFDFETTSVDPVRAEPVGISFSYAIGSAYYVGMKKKGGRAALDADKKLDMEQVFEELKPLFEDDSISKIGQNIKYEYIVLARRGIDLQGIGFDTMVASYVLNPSKLNHNLGDISLEYLGHKMTTSIRDLIGWGKSAITMDQVELEKVSDYSCEDSDVTFRLKKMLEKEIEKAGLEDLFYNVEIPLIKVLAAMEMNGAALDMKYLRALSKEFDGKLKKLTARVYDLAGQEFNINSPKQLSTILFEKLKLPVIRRTKTGFSTDEDVLRKLAPKNPMPEALLEYRELSKLKSTYVDSIGDLAFKETGRVHASFNQTVTATGRLSSSGPNLQNIPVKTEEGRRIRKAFIAYGKNDLLLSADYSQIELRLLAHLSNDRNLVKAFKNGLDIHSFTAGLIFDKDEKEVTEEMRGVAKTVNFGIVYGMSPYGLSQSLKISIDTAREFIDAYFKRYPDVQGYMEKMVDEARSTGRATTLLGRVRYIPEITSADPRMKGFAERIAINTPIQGSAADIIKVAMISINEALSKEKYASKMFLQVHDELVFNVPKNEIKDMTDLVRDRMENIIKLTIPVVAKLEVGKNWLEMERVG